MTNITTTFEIDEELINDTISILHLGLDEFSAIPLESKVIRRNGDVYIEAKFIQGDNFEVPTDPEMIRILKEDESAEIAVYIIKEGGDFHTVVTCDDTKEVALKGAKAMVVENFIKFKDFTRKEQLQEYIDYTHFKMIHLFETPFNEWADEDRISWGSDALRGAATCPECGWLEIEKIDDVSDNEELGINAHMFKCTECSEVLAVLTDKYQTVIDAGLVEIERNNKKTKKNKKKRIKKNFGKNKKKKKK